MNTFLVTTRYAIHSMDGSCAKEILTRLTHFTLSTDPYVVIVSTHQTPDEFIRQLREKIIKCDVTHLGNTVTI
jgi:hypothetical protein